MRFAFLADCHIHNPRVHGGLRTAGINRRCDQIIHTAFETACQTARTLGAQLIVAGDLFDHAAPTPQIIGRVAQVIHKHSAQATYARTILMRGNHDIASLAEGDDALVPFAPIAFVVGLPTVYACEDTEFLLIPYLGGDGREMLPKALDDLRCADHPRRIGPVSAGSFKRRVMVIHLGIITRATKPFLRNAHDAVPVELLRALAKEHKIDAIFAGNWHEHMHVVSEDDLTIWQIGSTAPTGFDNEGLSHYGRMLVYDSTKPLPSSVQVITLPGPRFLKLNAVSARSAEGALELALSKGQQVYVHIAATRPEFDGAKALLADWKADGLVVDGEVTEQDVETEAAGRTAAVLARKAESVADALVEYIRAIDLPEGVTPDEILLKVREYMGRNAARA